MKHPEVTSSCFIIDAVDSCLKDRFGMLRGEDVMEVALVEEDEFIQDEEVQEAKHYLDSTPKWENTLPPRGLELELGKSKLKPSNLCPLRYYWFR